jgi:putative restriction endonuclease
VIAIAPTHHGKIVNFWTPTPWNVRRLKPGDLLYFLLKAPIRKIAGFGHFVSYQNMHASAA